MTRPQSNFSQMRDFLYYLSTIKGDLSNIGAPPFVLSPKSVTEIPASWAAHHDLFLQPAREEDPARRSLLVLKNFLCSLKHQASTAASKKPLNAFLGELFIGSIPTADGRSTTHIVTEQVSHHPPVTASVIYNREHGMSSCGYVAQETTFSAASGVRVRQVGHTIVRDEAHQESHLRTMPTMAIRGLLTGRPYLELEGTCYISSSSGYLSTITFGDKRSSSYYEIYGVKGGVKRIWGSGASSPNRVHAVMTNLREDGKEVYEVTGQWTGTLTVRNAADGTVIEQFRVDDIPTSEVQVRPVERQSPWESRRAWRKVAGAIRRGDMNTVLAEKANIEEAQRQFRAAERRVGGEWPRVFFRRAGESREFALLARGLPHPSLRELETTRTAGVWSFIGFQAAEELIKEGVFHRGMEPTGQVLED